LSASVSHNVTSCSGFGNGNAPSNNALMMLNTAVHAPTPIASVRMTVAENPRLSRSERTALRKSAAIPLLHLPVSMVDRTRLARS
jgi:hypothetical protein